MKIVFAKESFSLIRDKKGRVVKTIKVVDFYADNKMTTWLFRMYPSVAIEGGMVILDAGNTYEVTKML